MINKGGIIVHIGEQIFTCLEKLSFFSSSTVGVTRLPFTKQHKAASLYVQQLMEQAGLQVEIDAIGNVIGRYIYDSEAKNIIMGSHQDTVKNGGKYDGALGIVLAIFCVGELIAQGQLFCNVTVVAFADEEGVRFHTDYLGSRAFNGRCDASLWARQDEEGVSLEQALRAYGLNPEHSKHMQADLADAYIEVHIEQGPVLDRAQLPVGIVTSIQSLGLFEVQIQGMAGHAGTVPMHLRQDSMLTASQAVAKLLQDVGAMEDVVATVGHMSVLPGAANVIAQSVTFSVDIRSSDQTKIQSIMQNLRQELVFLCEKNRTSFELVQKHLVPATPCDAALQNLWKQSIERIGIPVQYVASGAGHDAQEMAHVCPVSMLFVRCKDGISHHPQESVCMQDIHIAAKVTMEFLRQYGVNARTGKVSFKE